MPIELTGSQGLSLTYSSCLLCTFVGKTDMHLYTGQAPWAVLPCSPPSRIPVLANLVAPAAILDNSAV